MYSQTKSATRFQTIVAAVLIAAGVFFFTPPKQADAIVLMIVAAASATALTIGAVITLVIIDGIILCAAGVICSSDTDDDTGCSVDQGNSCRSAENSCGDYNTGTIACDGSCSAGAAPSDLTGVACPTNYCDMAGTGEIHCDGSCTSTVAPSNALCTGFDFPADALTIEPPLVRVGDTVDISWNMGTSNWPPTCTLEGENINVNFTGAGDASGTLTGVLVEGPHRYTLTCDDEVETVDVKVLPDIFDS